MSAATNSDRLFGIGCPVLDRHVDDGIDYTKSFALMHALGATAWRAWMMSAKLLRSPSQANPDAVSLAHAILAQAHRHDLDVVAVNNTWFVDGALPRTLSTPARDPAAHSRYRRFIADFEESFYTLAKTFPEVDKWEVGNEWNIATFLHPFGFTGAATDGPNFTLAERTAIATDLLYAGSRGVHRGNPSATTILGGLAPLWAHGTLTITYIKEFLELMYANIRSGSYPSTDPDDYFQAVAWHPYFMEELGEEWVRQNHEVYGVITANEGKDKPVYFTEFGYSEHADLSREPVFAEWIKTAYALVRQRMAYVKTMHYFRLFEDRKCLKERTSVDWGGAVEVYYGLFTEPAYGFLPKAKAFAFQQAAGGTGDLRMFAKKP